MTSALPSPFIRFLTMATLFVGAVSWAGCDAAGSSDGPCVDGETADGGKCSAGAPELFAPAPGDEEDIDFPSVADAGAQDPDAGVGTDDSEGGDPEGGDPEGGDPEGGDPEGGDPEGGDPEGGDTEGGEPEGGDPIPPEICDNGKDDDDDGVIDCADPECVDDDACIEVQCDDGTDNDDDGLVDCDDPNCLTDVACNPESCNNFYLCLAEEGCACTINEDCPDVGSDEFKDCQAACFENDSCTGQCITGLTQEVQSNVADFQNCTKTNCAGVLTDEEYYDCVLTICVEEYAQCFYTGENSCGEFYFQCAPDCEDDACVDACVNQLSPDGFLDAAQWDGCRFDLCNQDGDEEFDSDACYYIGSFFACIDKAGSCVPEHLHEGTGECPDISDCVLACEDFNEGSCVLACLELVSPAIAAPVSELFTCVIGTCGSTVEELTPGCAAGAIANSCQEEWMSCSG